jgi:hypothetical protein
MSSSHGQSIFFMSCRIGGSLICLHKPLAVDDREAENPNPPSFWAAAEPETSEGMRRKPKQKQ